MITRGAHAELHDGHLVVKTQLPSECAECADVDGDGLSDAWEDAILERLRPRLILDPQEPLLTDPDGAFGQVGRVFRPQGAPANIVRVMIIVGFSYDDGVQVLGWPVSAHDGDSERVGLELELRDGGREATVRRAYFSAHENVPNDHSRLYGRDEIARALRWGRDDDGEPRWLVFPSRSKHAEFADPMTCASSSFYGTSLFAESCAASEAAGHAILPPSVNAGERAHPRVLDLAIVGFPRESAWDGSPFCGGLRGSGHSHHSLCAGAIAKKLEHDPFR